MMNVARALLPLLLLLSAVAAPLSANGDEDMMDCPALRLADLGGALFIGVRHYEGLNPDDFDTIIERTREGFVPIISDSAGYVLYSLTTVPPDQLLAVNIFQSEEQMQAANDKAADFIAGNFADLLTVAPQITAGDVTVLALPGHCDDDMMHGEGEAMADEDDGHAHEEEGEAMADDDDDHAHDEEGEAMADDDDHAHDEDAMMDMQPLFLSFRLYTGVDPADVPAIAEAVAADFVQVISDSEGFRLYLNLTAEESEVYGAINVFNSEEEMTASNEQAAEFVAEALAELLPEAPTIISGDASIFHVADHESLMAMGAEEEDEE